MRTPEPAELVEIEGLLAANGLPTGDLAEQDPTLFLVVGPAGAVEAAGGLERCGDLALLRSVVVAERARGQGWAQALVARLEALAAHQGFTALYLLTESAERFFAKLGYVSVDRTAVPGPIRESRQFSALCPDSAAVMRKVLGDR